MSVQIVACCTATLIERYGPDQNMVDLRLIFAADCPKVVANTITDRCVV